MHFWIGWIAAIPIALVCFTGAFLIFEGQIIRWDNKEFFQLEVSGKGLSPQEAIDRYRSATPPIQVNHLGVPSSPQHAYSVYGAEILPEGNRGGQFFLNPYTGEVTRRGEGFSISHILIDVHRHLAAGRTGQLIIAISSLILAVTCIFGLILWWPLRGRTFVRALKRGQALDWHNALGLVALAPLVVMSITGITFTWGKHLWPILEKGQEDAARPAFTIAEGNEKLSVDGMIDRIKAELPDWRVTGIQPGNSKTAPVNIFIDGGGDNLQFIFNPYTGEELARFNPRQNRKGLVGWYRGNFGRLHTFGPYHIVLRILWGLLSLAGAILVATGLWVSIKRWRRTKRQSA